MRWRLSHRADPADAEIKAALILQYDFDFWRDQEGLNPSLADLRRLNRWARRAARASGVVFAPWAVDL